MYSTNLLYNLNRAQDENDGYQRRRNIRYALRFDLFEAHTHMYAVSPLTKSYLSVRAQYA